MVPLGNPAPHFSLINTVNGETLTFNEQMKTKATVIMFICNHCPYVVLINEALVKLANVYMRKGVNFIAISSNDVNNYPQDGPAEMTKHAIKNHYPFPYCFDETQSVAKAYQAACTPDFFVYDSELKLNYRGQFDDARPGNAIAPTGKDLSNALDTILTNQPPLKDQKPSLGCNIKWLD